MADQGIWVTLLIKGSDKIHGPQHIVPVPPNVGVFQQKVKQIFAPNLDYCFVGDLAVYKNTNLESKPLAANEAVPQQGNSFENPLQVFAPADAEKEVEQQQQQSRLNPTVTKFVQNWQMRSSNSSSSSLLRKRDRESEPGGEHKKVKLCCPAVGGQWYLGSPSDCLYLRSSVRDLGCVVLDAVNEFFGENKTKRKSALFVLSGASGIGKSWSINAFVNDLLLADRRVFLHLGETGEAYLISGDSVTKAEPIRIKDEEYNDVVYVYDSPESKNDARSNSSAIMRLAGVSLIFSSPKRRNYGFAYDKNSGFNAIKNIPAWTKEEMLEVAPHDNENVEASFRIWGGNMRAYERFRVFSNMRHAEGNALAELDAQVKCFDAAFTKKMERQLEKQDVDGKLNTEEFKEAPGHVLVPEPVCVDPKKSDCFEDFRWRFCSPLAEKKFYAHVKDSMKGVMTSLLQKVFEVPSSKGVLFEKVSHLLITNGVVEKFQSYKFTDEGEGKTEPMSFPECDILEFGNTKGKTLKESLEIAIKKLQQEQGESKTAAIALEPSDPNFDAVDMFVLVKSGTTNSYQDLKLYMLQDTIARKHSLHPVKVLWYCALFCDTLKICFELGSPDNSTILEQCSYVAVVPQEDKLSFDKPSSTSDWAEVQRVAELLDYKWPQGVLQGDLGSVVEEYSLDIPKTKDGKQKKLTRPVVGNALILENACSKVLKQCRVIFNVVAV